MCEASAVEAINERADWGRIVCPAIPWASIATTMGGTAPTREPRPLITCTKVAIARTCVEDGIRFVTETYPLVAEAFRRGCPGPGSLRHRRGQPHQRRVKADTVKGLPSLRRQTGESALEYTEAFFVACHTLKR